MKNSKFIILAIVLRTFALPIQAQISINQTDFASAGSRVITQTHTYADTVGSAGPNRFWDFSMLSGGPLDTINYVLPSQTPFSTNFPQSNLVAKYSDAEYTFHTLNATGYFMNGVASADLVIDPSITTPSFFRLNPPLAEMRFPAAYNNVFTSSSSSRLTIKFDTVVPNPTGTGNVTVDSLRLIVTYRIDSKMDAWGSLRLSGGQDFPVIRQKRTIQEQISIEVRTRIVTPFGTIPFWIPIEQGPPDYRNLISYWAKNQKYPLVEFELDSAGTEINYAISQYNVGTSTKAKKQTLALAVWPNPLTGSVLQIEGGPSGSLSLYSPTGTCVYEASLPETKNPRTIDVPTLASGIYLLKINYFQTHLKPHISTLTIQNGRQ